MIRRPPPETPEELKQWIVIVEQPMTYEEAERFGKAIAKQGYTGRFLNGSLATQVALIPRLKHEIKKLRGGDADGQERR